GQTEGSGSDSPMGLRSGGPWARIGLIVRPGRLPRGRAIGSGIAAGGIRPAVWPAGRRGGSRPIRVVERLLLEVDLLELPVEAAQQEDRRDHQRGDDEEAGAAGGDVLRVDRG